MTNDFQSIDVKQQDDRIEDLVNRLEKRIDDFEEDNNFSEKYYEDFSGLYFMMLWLLMKNGSSKDEVRMIQAKGYSYADDNYKSVK